MADSALTHRRVLGVAVPIVLSNASVPLLGIVDTSVVGQLGQPEPIGAVGLGAVILSSVYWIFGFLRMGMTGLAAQARGAGDRDEIPALLIRGLAVGLAGGALLIMVHPLIIWGGLRASPAGEEVESLTRAYMGLRIWSAPAAIALFALNGWLIAMERARQVLALQLWINGVNIALDLLFVPVLGWGVEGVAMATFTAEWSGLGLGLFLCRDALCSNEGNIQRLFEPRKLRRLAVVNGDILIRSVLLEVIFVSFLMAGARFGDVQLAANHILLQFLTFTAYALDGFAFSAESFVGQAIGAGKRSALRHAVRLTGLWAGAIALGMALGFAMFGGMIIDVMTTSEEVRGAARAYLLYMVMAPLVGTAAWMLDGIYIGAMQTRDMRDMMAVSFVIFVLVAVTLVPLLRNHGLWVAYLISFAARAITLGWRYPGIEARLSPAGGPDVPEPDACSER